MLETATATSALATPNRLTFPFTANEAAASLAGLTSMFTVAPPSWSGPTFIGAALLATLRPLVAVSSAVASATFVVPLYSAPLTRKPTSLKSGSADSPGVAR